MLELVRSLFEAGSRDDDARRTERSTPYDPDLVDELTSAQSDLFGKIRTLTTGVRNRDFVSSMAALERLDRGLRAYVSDAAMLFDEHMWYCLRRDASALALMRGVCAHLDELARYVRELVALYRAGQLSQRDFARVAQEIDSLGQALEHCLQTQAEKLFPLYRPVEEPQPVQLRGRLIAI